MGDYDLLVRNENYWGEKPAFESVKIKVIPEPQSRVVALETGGIDVILSAGTGAGAITISFEEFERLRAEGGYTTYLSTPRYTQGFAVNSNRKPTDELAVRQAIMYAVDVETFSKHLMLGIEPPAYSLFSKTTRYCDVNLPPYGLNRDRAVKLLEDAGWKLPQGGKIREKNGEKLELDIHFIGTHYFHKTAAAAIQGDLQKVGIQANLMADEANIFFGMGQSGNFNLAYIETWGVPSDPLDFLSSIRAPQGVLSHARLGLPMKDALDAEIGELMDSYEEQAVRDRVARILTTVHEQAVFLPVSLSVGIAVHKKDRVEGIRFMPLRNEIDFRSMKPGPAF
jgi:nickel transport system substrate-binding protein